MANWLNELCPKIDIKEDDKAKKDINNEDNSNQESLQIDIDIINNKTQLTEKKEYRNTVMDGSESDNRH